MASQNMDPAAAAASSTAALKGSESGGSAARGSVSKRLQQELMTLMVSFVLLFIIKPNNESPLNTTAAELWADQEAFRAHLHSTFQK
eukprot:superscaffoldBa00012171_g25546